MSNPETPVAPRNTEEHIVGRVPSAAEAHECLRRFINSHFRHYDRECARFSVPARTDHDDDLLLSAFIDRMDNDLNTARMVLREVKRRCIGADMDQTQDHVMPKIPIGLCAMIDVALREFGAEASGIPDPANKVVRGAEPSAGPRTSPAPCSAEYEALTVQSLRMLTEVFRGGGMSQQVFAREYLNGVGEYERKIARKHGITLPREFHRKPNTKGERS